MENPLSHLLESTAEWRVEKSKEYPDDERNLAAAKILEELSSDDVSPDAERWFTDLAENDEYSYQIIEAASELIRTIGFQNFPSSAEQLMRDIVKLAGVKPAA